MSNNLHVQPEPVIACNPQAIDSGDRDSHVKLSKEIFSTSTIQEIKELPDGYGFRLPLETPMLYKVIQFVAFVANERLCCPFFTFRLVVGEQFWLELTGAPDVKAVIQSDILKIVDTGIFPTLEALETAYTAATSPVAE